MNKRVRTFLILTLSLLATTMQAQVNPDTTAVQPAIMDELGDSILMDESLMLDTINFEKKIKKPKRDWATWRPNPKRAMWLALALPGAGQIYNRKYWKLPIIYGGFVGCAYAMRWNNQMYHDYSQAYLDLMALFKKRKDRFRRWRDMSFFVMVGVYALSVVDAYVDASLSEFDISDDLSLQVAPAVIDSHSQRNPLHSAGLGLQCSLTF